MKTTIDLSIIIISYNTKKITEDCLKSIYKSLQTVNFSYEILVLDNNSSDGSINMLTSLQVNPSIKLRVNGLRVIKNKENTGFAKANNQGVKESNGEYVLFLNSDIVVLNDAITTLFDYYRQHEHVINFLGGKLLNEDLSPQPSCGPFYSLPVAFAALFLKGDYWGLTRYSPNDIKEVDWISGACIITKKEYFESIDGFDENIFMYMDEIDMLYRAKKDGYNVFFYPKAQFIHLGSASSHGRTQPILQVYKGYTYFYKKHYNNPLSLFILKTMLQLKSWIALVIGHVTNNHYLIETYEKALQLV